MIITLQFSINFNLLVSNAFRAVVNIYKQSGQKCILEVNIILLSYRTFSGSKGQFEGFQFD